MKSQISNETDLYSIWELLYNSGIYLDNINLGVMYSGKFSPYQGPDFQGAEFELNGIRFVGDVEFHIKRKDWYLHHHDLDSRYDRVILHIVADEDEKPVTNSQNRQIQTLSFKNIISQKWTDVNNFSCRVGIHNNDQFLPVIKSLSIKWLDKKCCQVKKLHEIMSLEDCLYFLILRSQGYVANINNFEKLARQIPFSRINYLKDRKNPSIEFWICLFFGCAGFLPNQNMPELLNDMWFKISGILNITTICEYEWQVSAVRPNARPLIRLAIHAHFIHQLKESLFMQFYMILYPRQNIRQTIRRLIKIFKPEISDFYKNIFSQEKINWGDSFITEMIGNAIIPVFYFWSIVTGSSGFSDYLLDLYDSLPLPAHYGKIKKSKVIKNLNGLSLSGFSEQQAIMFLVKHYCNQSNCRICPILNSDEK